jgi:NAD(P)-dependent dehydrogenase (short-subunit alcohol dehydrogenase family)
VDKIVEESGAVHGIVVNAGRTNYKSALDFTTEEIEALFAVNIRLLPVQLWFLAKIRSSSAHSTPYESQHELSSNSTSKALSYHGVHGIL